MSVYNSAPVGIGARSDDTYSNKEPSQTITNIANDGSYGESSLTISNHYQINGDGIAYRDLPPFDQYRLAVDRLVNADTNAAGMPINHLILAIDNRIPFLCNTDGKAGHSVVWDKERREYRKDRKGRLITDRFYADIYNHIAAKAEADGNGVTWLPNQPYWTWEIGGIDRYHTIHFEMDAKGFDEQWALIDWFVAHGLIPTVIHSGGKSLHLYFMLDCPGDEWGRWKWLSEKAIAMGADPNTVAQRRRLMRFPGFYRHSKGKYQTLEMLSPADACYSLDFIEDIFKLWYEESGIDWDDQPVETDNKEPAESVDLSGVGDDIRHRLAADIINDLLAAEINLGDGSLTYDALYRLIAGLGNLIGIEAAIAYFEKAFPNQRNWQGFKSLDGFTLRLPTIKKSMTELLGREWNFPDYFNQSLPKKDGDIEAYKALVEADQAKLNNLSYQPDILIDSGYFPSLPELQKIKPLPNTGIIDLIGSKGAGKSTFIKATKQHYRNLGYKVVSLTPRIALGRGQAFDWDMPWRGDVAEDGVNTAFMVRNLDEISLCYESIKQLKDRDFTEKHLIILDESELGLAGLVTSRTMESNRARDAKIFGDMIGDVLANGGVVLLSDADLTDVSVDYIKSFGDNVPVFTIKNNSLPKQWEVEYFTGGKKPNDVDKALFDALANNPDKNYIYCTDSKDQAIVIEQKFTERFPGQTCININGDTTEDPIIKEMVKDINLAIYKNKPRLLIYTGSLGVGASIDGDIRGDDISHLLPENDTLIDAYPMAWQSIKELTEQSIRDDFKQSVYNHFDVVFCSFFHEQPSQCRQMAARYRKPVKRVIWATEYGYRDESCRSYRPDVLKRNLLKDKTASLMLIGLASEISGSDDPDDLEVMQALFSMLNGGKWDNPHLDLYCKIKARKNYAVSKLGEHLRDELAREGHLIQDWEDGGKNHISDALTEAKKQLKWEESAAIANADDIDEISIKRLQRKPSLSKVERAQLSKALIKQELPGIELSPGFIHDWIVSDRRRRLNALKLNFYCQHPDIAKNLDTKEFRYRLKQFGQGDPFLPDIRNFTSKVKVIQDVGFFELIDVSDGDRRYSATDADVMEFFDRCYMNRYRLNRSLGITVTKKTEPMALISRLGKKVGVSFISEKYREGEQTCRRYAVNMADQLNSDRVEIMISFEKKHAPNPDPERVSFVADLFSDGYNTQESSATNFSQESEPEISSTAAAAGDNADPFAGFHIGQKCRLWHPVMGQWIDSEIKAVFGGLNGFLKIQWLDGKGGDFMFGRDKLAAGYLAIA